MKNVCKILGVVVLVLGFFAAIFLAKTFGIDLDGNRSFLLTLLFFMVGMLPTTAFSIIFLALNEILTTLETINYNVYSSKVELDSVADDLELLKTASGIPTEN